MRLTLFKTCKKKKRFAMYVRMSTHPDALTMRYKSATIPQVGCSSTCSSRARHLLRITEINTNINKTSSHTKARRLRARDPSNFCWNFALELIPTWNLHPRAHMLDPMLSGPSILDVILNFPESLFICRLEY